MKNASPRFLALLLCCSLVFGLCPAAVTASSPTDARTAPVGLQRLDYGWLDPDYEIIFFAEYNGVSYVMGEGLSAIPLQNVFPYENEYGEEMTLSCLGDEAVLRFNAEYHDYVRLSSGSSSRATHTYYLSAKGGYLTLTDEGIGLALSEKEDANYWAEWSDSSYSGIGEWVDFYPQSNRRLVLETGDGDPYFTAARTLGDTCVRAEIRKVVCNHDAIAFIPEQPASCKQEGRAAHFACPDCGGIYADPDGLFSRMEEQLIIPPYEFIDENGDGVCDDCGRFPPAFRRVTDSSEIFAGGKYLLASEIDGVLYVLADDVEGYGEGVSLAAVPVSAGADGTVSFSAVKAAGGMKILLVPAHENCDFDRGITRYGILAVSSAGYYGLFSMQGSFNWIYDAEMKYGYRIALNPDGTALIRAVYNENWDDHDGSFLAFRSDGTEEKEDSGKGEGTPVNASELYGEGKTGGETPAVCFSDYAPEGVDTYPVYLYQMIAAGEVGSVSYTIADGECIVTDTTGYIDAQIPDSQTAAAVTASCGVSGMTEAITQSATDDLVAAIAEEEGVAGDTTVDLTFTVPANVSNVTPGETATYTFVPTVTYQADENGVLTVRSREIADSAFDGSPMTVVLYTCGFMPEQIVHIKNDGTREYFYPRYSEAAEAGKKTFTYTEANGENGSYGFVSFEVTEFSAITLNATAAVELPDVGFSTLSLAVSSRADGSVPGAVYLYSAALSDAEILADTGRAQALRAAAPGGSAANGVRFAQTFTFSSVDSGSYKVLCAKEGKHAPRILSVSVADGDVSLGTVSLLLYGDVNDDGAVNAKDALQISRYAAGKSSVFDAAADPAEEAYLLFAADVNGDGAANARDALQISRSAAGKSSVFDVMD